MNPDHLVGGLGDLDRAAGRQEDQPRRRWAATKHPPLGDAPGTYVFGK